MSAIVSSLVFLVRIVLVVAFGISLIFCLVGAYIGFGGVRSALEDLAAGRAPSGGGDSNMWTMLLLLWVAGGLAGCWASARLFMRYGLGNLGRPATDPWARASWLPLLIVLAAFICGVTALSMSAAGAGVVWFMVMIAALAWFITVDSMGLAKVMRSPKGQISE